MLNLYATVENLPKITKPHIAALKKIGISTIYQLLLHFPFRYLDFSKVATIAELKAGETVSLKVTIKNISSRFSFRSHLSITEAVVSDSAGSLKVIWFNQSYLSKTLTPGEEIFLAGSPEYYNNSLQMTNPIFEKVQAENENEQKQPIHTSRLVPVYRLTQNVYPKTFRNFVAAALNFCDELEEPLPYDVLVSQDLLGIKETVRFSHFPENLKQVEDCQKRLAFEEIFIQQLVTQKHKIARSKKKSFVLPFDQKLIKNFIESLPFSLTSGQKKAAWDILQDLEKPNPMNRLVEGDVGSGKTLVAFIACLEALKKGFQVALLTPTEILARQHFETAHKYLNAEGEKFKICLLTNSYSILGKENIKKPAMQKLIAEGMPGLFIGTHALLAEKVKFKNLSLVIVDEQHRFGVNQRANLVKNAFVDKKIPHLLSLTATPIPRTLQLAMYGELDISQIKTKPSNRKTIITKFIHNNDRSKAYEFIRNELKQGRQAFVITPLIEENDALVVKAVKTEFELLKKIFPEFSIALLHGKMKGNEKETIMSAFLKKETQILVSTSVIEVGVDIPNASCMVIEGAERFGLAQLHQFRGRVGRAEHQSYCFLFTEKENPEILTRLEKFTKTNDGFELSELDLKQRGFGELYGSGQSGWNFKYFTPLYKELILLARQEAKNILFNDFELNNHPVLKEKIKDLVVHFE